MHLLTSFDSIWSVGQEFANSRIRKVARCESESDFRAKIRDERTENLKGPGIQNSNADSEY